MITFDFVKSGCAGIHMSIEYRIIDTFTAFVDLIDMSGAIC
jgi:hypothetical protein